MAEFALSKPEIRHKKLNDIKLTIKKRQTKSGVRPDLSASAPYADQGDEDDYLSYVQAEDEDPLPAWSAESTAESTRTSSRPSLSHLSAVSVQETSFPISPYIPTASPPPHPPPAAPRLRAAIQAGRLDEAV